MLPEVPPPPSPPLAAVMINATGTVSVFPLAVTLI